MKRGVIVALIGLAGTSVCFAQKGGSTATVPMKTNIDSVSYAIGMNIGKSMKDDSIALNPDQIHAGIADIWAGKPTRLTDAVCGEVMANFQQIMSAPNETAGAKAKKIGKASLDSVSYAVGVNIGKSMKADDISLNADLIRAAIVDVWNGKPTRLSTEIAANVMMTFQQQIMQAQQAKRMKDGGVDGAENAKRGAEFLAANKIKPGVQTTASGLQYIVESQGNGESPDANDVVSVNYRGTLIDGSEFDKSQPGRPLEFPVNGVIRGWTEALQMMKPGAKWTLFIPADLAYGASGAGGVIGPNETLIFEVELLSVKKN